MFAFLQHVAIHSHSHPLAISNFIWAGSPGMPNEIHTFLSDMMQPWIPRAKHNVYRISHTLALSRSFAPNFLCWTECCIVNKTPEYARCLLELESLGWHVGWVKAVSSALEGLWDQAGVFINLRGKQINTKVLHFRLSIFKKRDPWMKLDFSSLHRLMRSTDQ